MKVAVVNQHHADQLDLSKSPLEFMLEKFPGDGTNNHQLALRSHLASCGVTGKKHACSKPCDVVYFEIVYCVVLNCIV